MDRKSASALLAFACLLTVATIIGCGQVPGTHWPGGGGSFGPAKFAFVVNSQPESFINGLTISAYSVDSATGALTPVSGSPFLTDASGCCGTTWIDVDPAGKFLFVPNRSAGTVSVFAIASNGALSEISGSPFSGGSRPFEAEVSPNGKFLYVSDESDDAILEFSIGSDGSLTSLGTAPTIASAQHLFIDPQGRFLYVTESGEGGALEGYTIKTDGTLAAINGFPIFESQPKSGRVDDSGKFLLIADSSDFVFVYKIDQTTGALTDVLSGNAGFPAGERPFGVLEVPVGNTIYMAVNNLGDGTLSVYSFDAATGNLTEVSGSPFSNLGLSGPHFMALATAQFAYVADQNNENVVGFTLDATGKPTAIASSPFTGGGMVTPSQIIFSH